MPNGKTSATWSRIPSHDYLTLSIGSQRGSNLTQQALLDLPLEGFAVKDLKKFVERVEYVLNANPVSHQPSEVTKFTWLYSRVKRCKLQQRHVDRIRDSSEPSRCRSWKWLMGKFKLQPMHRRFTLQTELMTTCRCSKRTCCQRVARPWLENVPRSAQLNLPLQITLTMVAFFREPKPEDLAVMEVPVGELPRDP